MALFEDYLITLSPKAYYHFDEIGTPIDAIDSSGNGYDLTYTAGITFEQPSLVDGSTNKSILFSGVNPQAGLDTTPVNLALDSDFSIVFGVKTTDINGTLLEGFSTVGLQWFIDANGVVKFLSAFGHNITGTTVINDGLPHIFIILKQVNSHRLYIDGNLEWSVDFSVGGIILTEAFGLSTGNDGDLAGTVDELGLFDKLLDEEETATLSHLFRENVPYYHNTQVGIGGIVSSGFALTESKELLMIEGSGGGIFSGTTNGNLYFPGTYIGQGGIISSGSGMAYQAFELIAQSHVTLNTELNTQSIFTIKDFLYFDSRVSVLLQYNTQATSILTLLDTDAFSLVFVLTDFVIANSQVIDYQLVENIALDSILLATKSLNGFEKLLQSIDYINIVDLAESFLLLSANDNISYDDIVVNFAAKLIVLATSNFNLSDKETHKINLHCLGTNILNIDDEIITQKILNQIAKDAILFIELVDDQENTTQLTYVINTLTKGISTYTDFDFNSASSELLCSKNGIYKRDKSIPVKWKIKTGLSSLGIEKQKQIPYVYLGLTNTGDLVLKTITDLNGIKKEVWYKSIITKDSYDTTRVILAKGIKSKYWQFELMGEGTVELDSIELMVLELKRRI